MGWLIGRVLWYVNLSRLFNTKSFIHRLNAICLVWFDVMATSGHLMPNPVYTYCYIPYL